MSGNKTYNFAVLGSTNGSSLLPILEACQKKQICSQPTFIFSNKKNSGILQKAHQFNIDSLYHPINGLNRESYDIATSQELTKRNIDFILLIGYMRILSPYFVNRWKNLIINVHPSLLPKYEGLMDLQIHKSVLQNKDTETGCTIHIVTEEVDNGQILLQKKCKVHKNDTPESLKSRVQKLEGEAFIEILQKPNNYLDIQ